jgi:hypothetical protein
LECLGLHNKPEAAVHPGHLLTGPKEEEEEEEKKKTKQNKKRKDEEKEKKRRRRKEEKKTKKKRRRKEDEEADAASFNIKNFCQDLHYTLYWTSPSPWGHNAVGDPYKISIKYSFTFTCCTRFAQRRFWRQLHPHG